MPTVTIHQAKTNLSRLIERASAGEEIIIARGSKPVARLVPVGAVEKGSASLSSLKGKLETGPEVHRASSQTTNSRTGSSCLVKALFDTHALIWWFSDDSLLLSNPSEKLSSDTENTLLESCRFGRNCDQASARKTAQGRRPRVRLSPGRIEREGFQLLPISAERMAFALVCCPVRA